MQVIFFSTHKLNLFMTKNIKQTAAASTEQNTTCDASTVKRLIVMIYDSFIAAAILMFTSAFSLIFTGGEAPAHTSVFISLFLLLVLFVFFAWFWTRSGQTLGMQAWRLKLIPTAHEGDISWPQAALRFLSALPAWAVLILAIVLSFRADDPGANPILNQLTAIPGWVYYLIAALWLVIDNRPGNWREKITATRVIQLQKKSKPT